MPSCRRPGWSTTTWWTASGTGIFRTQAGDGTPGAGDRPGSTMNDWYRDALIYQLHVKGFQDSNGDGLGDFRGLASRLDYLQDLGVDCLWLLPLFPSPLRDDGYDIADYCGVHPDYGTLDDFQAFLDEAHRRGIRVLTELVLTGTATQP